MNIENGLFFTYATAKALPAVWSLIVSLVMGKAGMIRKYCPPATELPPGMTDFQKTQYENQCRKLGVYLFQVDAGKHKKPLVKPAELIGPPEPAEQKP